MRFGLSMVGGFAKLFTASGALVVSTIVNEATISPNSGFLTGFLADFLAAEDFFAPGFLPGPLLCEFGFFAMGFLLERFNPVWICPVACDRRPAARAVADESSCQVAPLEVLGYWISSLRRHRGYRSFQSRSLAPAQALICPCS